MGAGNDGPFYHGTTARLRSGAVVKPSGGPRVYRQSDPSFAYATSGSRAIAAAWAYAERAAHASDTGSPRVYEVRPLGEHERDPNGSTDPGDRRCRAGWKVVRQLPQPKWAKNW